MTPPLLPELPAADAPDASFAVDAFESAIEWPFLVLMNGTENYSAGSVQIGCNADALVLCADLPDADIQTSVTEDNQNAWSLGDVVEIFVKAEEHSEYLELHVTPNHHCLQLRFPLKWDSAEGLGPFKVKESIFSYRVEMLEGGWRVFARVPLASITPNPAHRTLLLSVCRYDYVGDSLPVLSSTSAHEAVSYHRIHEWRPVRLPS